MNYEVFYDELFRPIEKAFGRIDRKGIFHIIGFDCGGPLNFSTIGADEKKEFVTYISCELAVREGQIPSSHGRFELMCRSNDEAWVRRVLTKIGQMSLEAEFDHGHTVDISEMAGAGASLRGVIVERFATVEIDSKKYCILCLHGISKEEMQLAIDEGSGALFEKLKKAGVYPRTDVRRKSVV